MGFSNGFKRKYRKEISRETRPAELKRDNLHISFRCIDGHQKLFNLIVCEREAGKSCELYYTKVYKAILKGQRVVIIKRHAKSLNTATVLEIQTIINQFLPTNKQIAFRIIAGTMQSGIIYFEMDAEGKTYQGGAFLWLGLDDQYIKSMVVENPVNVIFDEYIVNTKAKERYIENEMNKIKILYGTLKRYEREKKIRFYFCGNPYTRYNPLMLYLGVNTNTINPGCLISRKNYLIWCYQIKQELRAKLLEKNPLYKFDDTYKSFALEGQYAYDKSNLILKKQPKKIKLSFILCYNNYSIGVFLLSRETRLSHLSRADTDCAPIFFLKIISEKVLKTSKKPKYCFKFTDVDDDLKIRLIGMEEKEILQNLKNALRLGYVRFYRIEAYNLINELFDDFVKKI